MSSATAPPWPCNCTRTAQPSSASSATSRSCRTPTTAAAFASRSPGYAVGWKRIDDVRLYVGVITGFNTDIKHNEKVYHIQTEDKGLQNPYVESLVYVGGEILASKKTSYAEQLKTGVDEKWIGSLMEEQHRHTMSGIKSWA